MPENIGGLDYKLDMSGNFEEKLALFKSEINALKAQSKSLKAPRSGGGGGGGPRGGDVVARKLLSLEQRLIVLKSEEVTLLQAVVDLEAKAERAKRTGLKASDKALQNMKDRKVVAQFLAKEEKKRTAEIERGAKAEERRRRGVLAEQQKAFNALKVDSSGTAKQAADAKKLADYNNISLQASQRTAKAERELAIKKAQILAIQKKLNISQRAAAEQVGITSAQAKQLKLNMWDAQHAARQFLFTFRRLVGILAVFTLARELASNIAAAAREMITFNKEMESATIAIATILTSVGQVRDSQGGLVTGADAFNIALSESRGILDGLKKDALGSIATFEALVQAYQVAVGPGLAAGLDTGQIREVSKRLTEGALAMGIPLNQLSEEIRSLLKGTATARNTRIAVLFGGAKEANEAIRNAAEQGNLYEVLMEKLEGVKLGADAAGLSLEVLKSNLQDSVQLLLAEGGFDAFEKVKQVTLDLAHALRDTDTEGNTIFSPQALSVVNEMSAILGTLVDGFRNFFDASDATSVLTNTLRTLRGVLQAITPVAVTAFASILNAIAAVLDPISEVVAGIGAMVDAISKTKGGKTFLNIAKYTATAVIATRVWVGLLAKAVALTGAQGILGNTSRLNLAIKESIRYQTVLAAASGASLGAMSKIGIAVGVIAKSLGVWGLIIGAILGVFGILNSKLRLTDKWFGRLDKQTDKAKENAEKFEGFITGSADAASDGAESMKDWADELENVQKQLTVASLLRGLQGEAREFGSIIAEGLADIEEATKPYKEQIALVQKQREEYRGLKGQIEELERKALGIDQQDASGVIQVEPDIEKAVSSMKDLEAQQRRNIRLFNELPEAIGGEAVSLGEKLAELRSKEAIQLQKIADGTAKIQEKEKVILDIMNAKVSLFNAQYPKQFRLSQLAVEDAKSQTILAKLQDGRGRTAAKQLAILETKVTLLRSEAELQRQIRQAGIDSLQGELEILEASDSLATSENVRLDTVDQINKLKADNVRLTEEENAKIAEGARASERSARLLSGSVRDAFQVGLEDVDFKPLGEQMASTITDAVEDISGVIGGLFKDAIDPRTDADLKTAFGEFFLDIAGRFAEALTEQLIISPLVENLTKALSTPSATDVAGEQAGGGLLQEGMGLVVDAITGLGTAILGFFGFQQAKSVEESVQSTAQKVATTSTTAAVLAGNVLLGQIAASTAATAVTAAVGAHGGYVQAFAKGGGVRPLQASGPFPRPSGIPASDTVPAWLTPGEFVMKRATVAKWGASTLAAINNGVINPASFAGAASSLRSASSAVQGFASGGSVLRPAASSNNGQTQTIQQQIVLPVLPASESTMDQMISGGRSSFTNGVNKVDYVGDPNKSTKWS